MKQQTDYGNPEYWEKRYQQINGQRFDWLEDYESLKPYLEQCMINKKNTKILNVGCGNATIQQSLYEDGYHRIVNNDISQSVINEMKEYNQYEEMIYEVMDITNMTYKNESFDLIIDKSTMDALLCSCNPLVLVAKLLSEVYRVLVPGGIYFVVSYGEPPTRMEHFRRNHVNFKIAIYEIKKKQQYQGGNSHFLYICTKLAKTQQNDTLQSVLKQLQQQEQNGGQNEKNDIN